MSAQITLDTAMKLQGYLEKKSPSIFQGFQKRYISISEGKFILYFEKKGDKPKGCIELNGADIRTDTDKRVFKITFIDREFVFRAENEAERNYWVENLLLLVEELGDSKHKNIKHRGSKRNVEDCTKEAYESMIKSGIDLGNKADLELDSKCLDMKGISKYLEKIDLQVVENRIYHSFLKKNKEKFWCFIISSLPLTDFGLDHDDLTLEEKVLPSFLSFDTLYFYHVLNDHDNSQSVETVKLSDVLGLEKRDDNTYDLIIDIGEEKIELVFQIRGLRDKWMEILKNSRKTRKDISASITKRPRNISRLKNLFDIQGLDALKAISSNEAIKIESKYEIIEDRETLEFLSNDMNKVLLPTIDSCLLSNPPNVEIIKIWVDNFNDILLGKVYKFWKERYLTIDSSEMIDLATYLYNFSDNLEKYGVKDPNFSLNGREFLKIYAKKTYFTMRDMVQKVINIERLTPPFSGEGDLLITNGPTDLFKLFYTTLEVLKSRKIKFLTEQMIEVFKECLEGYILAIDYFVKRYDLQIDHNFLVAVANNCIEFNNLTNDLIENLKSSQLLDEKEVQQLFSVDTTQFALKAISETSIKRIVEEIFSRFSRYFNCDFFSLDLNKFLTKFIESQITFESKMHFLVKKKFWTKIINKVLLSYINTLLTKANKKIKSINELKSKLDFDYNLLMHEFEGKIGKNSMEESLKILKEFYNFISSESDLIGISCLNIREASGPSFSLETVKSLIKLRVDLSKQKAEQAILSCEKVLSDYNLKNKIVYQNSGDTAIFEMIEKDLEEKEKEEQEKVNSYEQNVLKFAKKKKKAGPNKANILGVTLVSEEETNNQISQSQKMKKDKTYQETEEVIEISIEGYLEKKSSSGWDTRFFQLKNKILFWYKDKDSKTSQNFINLKEIKRLFVKKTLKFVIEIKDKTYKFKCESNEERDKWFQELEKEFKSLNKKNSQIEIVYTVKLRAREINDYFNFPSIHDNKDFHKNKLEEALIEENFPLKKNEQEIQMNFEESTLDHIESSNTENSQIKRSQSFLSKCCIFLCPCFLEKKKDPLMDDK